MQELFRTIQNYSELSFYEEAVKTLPPDGPYSELAVVDPKYPGFGGTMPYIVWFGISNTVIMVSKTYPEHIQSISNSLYIIIVAFEPAIAIWIYRKDYSNSLLDKLVSMCYADYIEPKNTMAGGDGYKK